MISPVNSTTMDLRSAWRHERADARGARRSADTAREWHDLERAHILSQPAAGLHVRTHLAMLAFAIRNRQLREVAGQVGRALLAAPGSWTGRYPLGNTGGAAVSAFEPMQVPADLCPILGLSPS